MNLQDTQALVTGANRGLGAALVAALVEAGSRTVYAAARQPELLAPLVATAPDRIVPVGLDVTDDASVRALADQLGPLQVIVNNAGVLAFGDALGISPDEVRRQLEVNLFGTLRVTQAFAPRLRDQGQGAIVNILSVVALASMPGLAGYNASKAAAHSLTQSLRATLKPAGVSVHGVYPGPIDTDMAAEIPFQKTSPADVARAVVEAVRDGVADIFPDAMSAEVGALWRRDPQAIEARFAAM